jgi:Transposase IS66 family
LGQRGSFGGPGSDERLSCADYFGLSQPPERERIQLSSRFMASSAPGLIAFASMCSKAEAVVDHGEVAGGQFETMAIGVGNHLTAGRRSWSRLGLGRKRRRTGHNLLLRLATRKQDVLRFPIDPRLPFSNNEAERDGRMMKVKTEDLQ